MAADAEIRANRAKQLLDDPLMVEAFARYEQSILEELLNVPYQAGDRRRQRLIDRIKTVRSVRDHLRMVIAQGKISERGAIRAP